MASACDGDVQSLLDCEELKFRQGCCRALYGFYEVLNRLNHFAGVLRVLRGSRIRGTVYKGRLDSDWVLGFRV